MLKRLSVFACIGLVALATGALAHEIKHKAITIVHPWVMETEQPEAVLSLKIRNGGEATERLLRASTPLAQVRRSAHRVEWTEEAAPRL